MAPYKQFPKALIYRGHLSGWGVLFPVVLAGAWCPRVAQCAPARLLVAPVLMARLGATFAVANLLQPSPAW